MVKEVLSGATRSTIRSPTKPCVSVIPRVTSVSGALRPLTLKVTSRVGAVKRPQPEPLASVIAPSDPGLALKFAVAARGLIDHVTIATATVQSETTVRLENLPICTSVPGPQYGNLGPRRCPKG